MHRLRVKGILKSPCSVVRLRCFPVIDKGQRTGHLCSATVQGAPNALAPFVRWPLSKSIPLSLYLADLSTISKVHYTTILNLIASSSLHH